jgi:hypothetical protein
LFWKKTTDKNASSKKLFSTPDEVRSSFRVVPQLNAPLKATLNETPISIINISSGGFRFKKIDLKVEKFYLAEIIIPLENQKISALVELLDNTEENIYRCKFVDLPQDIEDLIHRYVMNRQKEEQEFINKPTS